jgi:hypothetical protein
MIIFNTIKQAEHYVKWCQKNMDYNVGHYEWRSQTTYIKDNLVLQNNSGDSCGCGCDNGKYSDIRVLGRIKSYNTKTIRDRKMIQILDK